MSDTELIQLSAEDLEPKNLLKMSKIEAVINQIRAAAKAVPQDLTTKAGRDLIASTAYKVSQHKVKLEKISKNFIDEMKAQIKPLEDAKKKIVTELEDLRDEVRKPLTDWESTDKVRTAAIKAELDKVTGFHVMPYNSNADAIRKRLEDLKALPAFDAMEFQAQYDNARLVSTSNLERQLTDRESWEYDQAELAELRKQREAAAATSQAELPTVQKAPEVETTKVAQETAAVILQDGLKEYKRQVNRSIMEKFAEFGASPDLAESLLKAIVLGKIPNVKVIY